MMRTAVVKTFSLGMITGSFLTAGVVLLAAPAKADTGMDILVCDVLSQYPSVSGVLGIGLALKEDGYSAYEAGQVIGQAVINECPQYGPLMRKFIALYGTDDSAVA